MSETEQPPEPIRLSVASIVAGQYIGIGEPTPFMTESDVPQNLKPYIGGIRNEMLPHPSDRDIYLSPQTRRQARRLEATAEEKDWAEQVASEPLREDVAAALPASHDIAIGKALAQAKYHQDAIDNAHTAAQESVAQRPEHFVKRGAIYSRASKSKLRPAENVYVRRPSGEWECIGQVDSAGELPPQEIIT
jgi:hypothetical protein